MPPYDHQKSLSTTELNNTNQRGQQNIATWPTVFKLIEPVITI